MATRKRRKAEKASRRPPTPRELRELAAAQLLTSRVLVNAAKARAIEAATKRGDRAVGFALADAPGSVAAQDREDE